MASRLPPRPAASSDRYLVVPCDGPSGLSVIWDRLEEQVVDVIAAGQPARYAEEDALWDEGREPLGRDAWRIAA